MDDNPTKKQQNADKSGSDEPDFDEDQQYSSNEFE